MNATGGFYSSADFGPRISKDGGTRRAVLFGLIANMGMAAKISQVAKNYHLDVHYFDKAERLVEQIDKLNPCLSVLDWDDCENEAFKVLKAISENPKWKHVSVIGYVSQSKASLKTVAEGAGCLRVYLKTAFLKELGDLILRYAC